LIAFDVTRALLALLLQRFSSVSLKYVLDFSSLITISREEQWPTYRMLSSSVVASQEGYKRSFHAADRPERFLENKMISYIAEIL
jgi:hypothetical protein